MNKIVKAQWIKALRSGRYAQGRYKLRRTRLGKAQYCCLGVLCRVQGLSFNKNNITSYKGEACVYKLSNRMLRDIGLKPREQDNLMSLNDSGKYNFKYIANYIESMI